MYRSLLITITLVFSGCGILRKKKDLPGYVSWAKSDAYPFRSSVVSNSVEYSLTLYTSDPEMARATSNNAIAKDEGKNYLKSIENTTAAVLTIDLPEKTGNIYEFSKHSDLSASDRDTYFSFHFTPAFKALTFEGDMISCTQASVERGNNAYHHSTANLEFPCSYTKIQKVLFNDVVFSESQVEFSFKKIDNQQYPKLKL